MLKNFIYILFLLFFISTAYAESSAVFNFLKLHNNPINASLNHSNYSFTDRNGNILANPALLPKIPRYYLQLNSNLLFDDYKMYGAHYTYPLKNGFLTAGLLKDDMPLKLLSNQIFNESDKYENFLYYISYGVKIYQFFNIGTTIKYVEENIDDIKIDKVIFDFGMIFEIVKDDVSFGISIQNIGNTIQIEGEKREIPTIHGIGFNFKALEIDNIILSFVFSNSKIADESNFQSAGAIIKYKNLNLFTGYSTRDILNDKVNYGLSFEYGNANFAIARSQYADKGSYISFNLSLEFGGKRIQKIQKLYKLNKTDKIKCLNCGYDYLPQYNYCPKCGQSSVTIIN